MRIFNSDKVHGKTIVNGVEYASNGGSVSIVNGKVIIDGVVQDKKLQHGPVTVVVQGDCGDLEVAAGTVKVDGSAQEVSTGSGDVSAKNIAGNVRTGSGDVSAKNIAGNVRTGSGDINHRFL